MVQLRDRGLYRFLLLLKQQSATKRVSEESKSLGTTKSNLLDGYYCSFRFKIDKILSVTIP
jgi:hypothetical protein